MSKEQVRAQQNRLQTQRSYLRVVVIVVAILVIVPALWLASLSFATMWVASWDPCSWMGAVILLPFTGYIAFEQYRAAFHGQSRAATRSALVLAAISALVLFGFATTVGELSTDSIPLPWGSLLFPMLILAIVMLGMAAVNYLWSRQLKLEEPPPSYNSRRLGCRCFDTIAGLLSALYVIGSTAYYVNEIPPRCAEHVSASEAPAQVPPNATDVTFCQGSRGMIAYEFTIDERGFVEWVESGIGSLESEAANIPVKTITEPFTFKRYGWLSPDREDPELATIEEGLYYAWSKEDQGVYAVYDRTSSRAYYYAHYH